MASERTPQQIIGDDAYMQLVFEGYVVSRPAPAATDTGLVTVAWQRKHPTEGWMDCREEDIPHYQDHGQEIRELSPRSQAGAIIAELQAKAKDYREYSERLEKRLENEEVTRSQAEELLAAERAENARLMKINEDHCRAVNTLTTDGARLDGIIRDLKSDNAAKDARIKELEKAIDHSEGDYWRFLHNQCLELGKARTALVAKLAAAEKALEPFADHAKDRAVDAAEWRNSDTVQIVVTIGDLRKARAVRGGKPS